ncbi:glycoside hydrolase family 2 [Halomonas sp. MCCC 1A11036]|uniref:Glycoside hydrolase family 2 n=1 Tax=Billgrantia zhangzhouensis TaxID=2733481 RepID=A0ABS9AC34_9GAMM|nr:glycoside hydrolase family 2 TIM barrel-domain containing protein [Halomonas zhangzhouensis]MCE8019486.1 glycoside hydrolase family 2 [Halomonas zhangzhouensis]
MLERSTMAENALTALHDEQYDVPLNSQNLNHHTMVFTKGRESVSLNGSWNFCVDLLDTGLRQKWYELQPASPADRTEPWDYDPFMGETVPVPSNWAMLKEKWYFFEGSAWYTRRLDVAIQPEERYVLRVGAAQYDCKVFMNGKFLGNHYGGSTPFYVELTEHLADGENWLMLCVNNTRTLDRVPMRNTDWFNYGGVYRDVELFTLPGIFIKDMFVRLSEDGCSIEVDVALDGLEGGKSTTALLEVPELGIAQHITVTQEAATRVGIGVGRGRCCIAADPERWSPANPRLYDVVLTAGDDRITDRVGFRTIVRDGVDILLNGEPVWLRGISVHEDDEAMGKVTSEEDIRRRLAHAKELGCNYLRLAHYPHHERVAELADEMGFMLWQEIPVYWAIDFESESTFKDAKNQLAEVIFRDRNRASVIIWSVGNENPDTDSRLRFMRKLTETARLHDPTRLVAAACLINHAKLKIEDRLAEHLDVIGINEYYGWYDENIEDLRTIGENSNPDRPVVISETGADGDNTCHGPVTGWFSESYMAEVYRQQIGMLRELEYIKGMSPWILYDFRVERRQNIYQRGFNRKGLISADKRTKKEAFDVLAAFYHEMKDK